MQSWFDSQQQILADMIEPHENNVGHFVKQFATGGLADAGENSDLSLISRIANAAKQSTTGADASASGGKYGDSPLGTGYYNSVPYIAHQYTNLGKFFNGAEQGNRYTDRYEQPQKNPAIQAEDPNKFYSKWYEGMRRFAEASEVADRGQTQSRIR